VPRVEPIVAPDGAVAALAHPERCLALGFLPVWEGFAVRPLVARAARADRVRAVVAAALGGRLEAIALEEKAQLPR